MYHSKAFILSVLIWLSVFVQPVQSQQYHLRGNIRNDATNQPLAFVNIRINEGRYGGTSDIDGNFSLSSPEPFNSLHFTYVGFEPMQISLEPSPEFLNIRLFPSEVLLEEVTILPGENPAHRIISNVLKNRDMNNPEKMNSFSYKAYDKMVFTIDSANAIPLQKEGPIVDSASKNRAINFVEKRDFFLMETVTERSFLSPGLSQEKVLATRIAGLRNPIFLFLISQWQSTSFYKEQIRIGEKNYINPISGGSTRKYLFVLEEETPVEENDTIFTISYRPYKNTNFDGLKGVIMIHSDGWAIQNVIAEPNLTEAGFSIKIQQLYEKIDEKQWFPVQLNTDLLFNSITANDGQYTYPFIGKGKSYLYDIQLNPDLDKSQFNKFAIELEPNAADQTEATWEAYRNVQLTARELETYRFIDSLSNELNFDRWMGAFESLLSAQIPVGPIDIELDKLLKFNNYEGYYLGLGLTTNHKLSQRISFNGFWGYGFKDKTNKYGLGTSLKLDPHGLTNISVNYYKKAEEAGLVYFPGDKEALWTPEGYKHFYVNRMVLNQGVEVWINTAASRHFTWHLGFTNLIRNAFYPYYFGVEKPDFVPLKGQYNFTTIQVATRFAFREQFIKTSSGIMSMGTDFPVIWLKYSRGLNNLLQGEHTFNRFDFRLDQSFYTKYLGETSVRLQAGLIQGEVPFMALYNSPASWSRFGLYAPHSFATMRINEFLSDRYAALFLTHNFGKLLYRKGMFQPELALATHIGFGGLKKPALHHGIAFNTMEKGFYESGLLLNNLLRLPPSGSLGLGVFYRYGPYSRAVFRENLGYKFTFTLAI
jgi:hypothetical protein